jgi:CRISPR-associated protein Cmr4
LVGAGELARVPSRSEGHCLLANPALLSGDKLHLEAFEYDGQGDSPDSCRPCRPTSPAGLPAGDAYAFFVDKLKTDLVVLSDTDFGYFAEHAMLVEPHVRIDENTGTAK